jgi:hypothetical protein
MAKSPKGGKGGKGGTKPETADASGRFGNLWTNQILPLLGSARTYIVTAILGALSYLAVAGWHQVDGVIQKYVADSISTQLDDEKSPLFLNLSKAMEKMRKSDVGEVTTGTFILTTDEPHYLILYVPADKKYTAQMLYRAEQPFPACQHVDVVAPDAQKPSPLPLDDYFLDLQKMNKRGSSQTPDTEEDAPRDKASGHLRDNLQIFTFQLKMQAAAEMSAACSNVPQRLRISYVTLVAPTIHMGQ